MFTEFNLRTFANEPSLQVVQTLKKSHLQPITMHFKLSMTTLTRKDKHCNMVMEYSVDEELVPEENSEAYLCALWITAH